MVRPIVLYPDPRLKQRSRPVVKFDGELRLLASDMTDTMREASGLGLSAVQVGELIRFMVMEPDFEKEDHREALFLANPEITSVEGSQVIEEGCLSLPDVRAELERPYRIEVTGQDLEGRGTRHTFEGMLARCALHEIDHMNGQLFIERLPAIKRLLLKTRLKELHKKYQPAKV